MPNVGTSVAVSSPVQTFAPTINVAGGGGTPDQNEDLARRMESRMRDLFDQMYAKRTVKEMRYGGLFNS